MATSDEDLVATEALADTNPNNSSTVANLQLIRETEEDALDQLELQRAALEEQNAILKQLRTGLSTAVGFDLAEVEA